MYAAPWFISLYTNILPFNTVVRIFDCLLYEKTKILYRAGLAIMKIREKKISQAGSIEQLMNSFREYKEPEFYDEDNFCTIMFKFSLSKKEIEVNSQISS